MWIIWYVACELFDSSNLIVAFFFIMLKGGESLAKFVQVVSSFKMSCMQTFVTLTQRIISFLKILRSSSTTKIKFQGFPP